MRLPSGLVGVNEACSGVRSLQTSIMIGLLFGELKRLSLWQRIFLVIAGVSIALFANFLRVLFLVSMASRAHDVSVVNKWHDLAGYGILLLVFIGTMWLAGWIGRGAGSKEQGGGRWEIRCCGGGVPACRTGRRRQAGALALQSPAPCSSHPAPCWHTPLHLVSCGRDRSRSLVSNA